MPNFLYIICMGEFKIMNEILNGGRMTQRPRWNVLKAVRTASTTLEGSAMSPRHTRQFDEACERLGGYFGTGEKETWILCAAVCLFFEKEHSISYDTLSKFFGFSNLDMLMFKRQIDMLLEKKLLLVRKKQSPIVKRRSAPRQLQLPPYVINAVLNNTPVIVAAEKKMDYMKFVGHITSFLAEDSEDFDLYDEVTGLEDENAGLEFVQKSLHLISDFEARTIFYVVCSDFLDGDDTRIQRLLAAFYNSSKQFMVAKEMMNETHTLFKRGLVEFERKGSINDATVTLTDKGREFLLGDDAELFCGMADAKNLIVPDTIKSKQLFYSEENLAEIDRVRNALTEENFCAIQKRLSDDSMPKGVAILLYGSPGTGKTETVYQIARATGRKIFHIDISDTKSCWFGESEKKIKKVFTDYRRMCGSAAKSESDRTPILFFNEADAVFSKRKDSAASNVAQTENAIQNIILEEMEKLDGILIATTNLADNLDAAFERRFLFKVRFENPTAEAKKMIWKSKLTWLSEENAERFADSYDFSGGEIDNVARKVAMEEIITGMRPSVSQIEKFCETEKLSGHRANAIGF